MNIDLHVHCAGCDQPLDATLDMTLEQAHYAACDTCIGHAHALLDEPYQERDALVNWYKKGGMILCDKST